MNADSREEIAASVAAHAELGPRYDAAVAEGLVERIGEEIDKRIEARLGGLDHAPGPRQPSGSPGQRIVPPGYQGSTQAATAPAATVPAAPQPVAPRRSNGWTGMVLGLGSMGLGVGATAVVISHHTAALAQVFMIVLIWLAILGINEAHAKRK